MLSTEEVGEIQTSVRSVQVDPSLADYLVRLAAATRPSPDLALGDPVICRHAKAGELAERFETYLLVRGNKIVGREPTYRGLGKAFM